ncbi:hypothetical protein H6G52_00785 [Limnothrix sp. FACHB-881]|uniref:hypothetical protein n=1 Tax=Limnothrix sp. FACHB-881 TaxID=2692819 RepID=UPI00168553F5|nr:hypothetical protein [Limnothrix sp. FACHB-881]MBD2633882.1 hypothetical protein [Limnothrix sp. FACHB-881]
MNIGLKRDLLDYRISVILNIQDLENLENCFQFLAEQEQYICEIIVVADFLADDTCSAKKAERALKNASSLLLKIQDCVYLVFKSPHDFSNVLDNLKYTLSLGLSIKGNHLLVLNEHEIPDKFWVQRSLQSLDAGIGLVGTTGILYLCSSFYANTIFAGSHKIVLRNLNLSSYGKLIPVDFVMGSLMIKRSYLTLIWNCFPTSGSLAGYLHLSFWLQQYSLSVAVNPLSNTMQSRSISEKADQEISELFVKEDEEYFQNYRSLGWKLIQE